MSDNESREGREHPAVTIVGIVCTLLFALAILALCSFVWYTA